jgi:hypothetical protein
MTAAQHQAALRAAQARRHRNPSKIALMMVLFIVGLGLLYPAVWSVGILGKLWPSPRADAQGMALMMLICWPLALGLLGGAALLLRRFLRAKP